MQILKIIFFFSFLLLHTSFPQSKNNADIINQKGYIKSEFIFPLESKPTPQCHASTIAETKEGLIASWFGGTEEKNPDVAIWVSRFIKGIWLKPVQVADGIQSDGSRYPCWNPVLFQPRNGKLMLFYKVGPDPQKWWGMLITSSDCGKTWSKPVRLPDGILGPIKNKPVQLKNGKIISPSSTEDDGWKIYLEISADNGKSWTKTNPLNDGKEYLVIQPSILFNGGNKIELVCRSRNGFIMQAQSPDNGLTWGKLSPTNLPNPNSGIDAVTLKNGTHLIVYNHTGMIEGRWGGERTPLNVAISKDGVTWKPVITLENEPGEYSYPAAIQTKDGLVHIVYTYKRETIKHVVLDSGKFK